MKNPETLNDDLNAALHRFELACSDFRKTRCHAYLEMVRISANQLMLASDACFEAEREILRSR